MKAAGLTQRQISARLGVSQTLVSCVLNGKADKIGAATQTVSRIQKALRLGWYVPSAPALRGASTKTISVVVRNFEDLNFGFFRFYSG